MSRATDTDRLREALTMMRKHWLGGCRCGGSGRCVATMYAYATRELAKLNTREARALSVEADRDARAELTNCAIRKLDRKG